MTDHTYEIARLTQMIRNIVRVGIIEDVETSTARASVRLGDNLITPLLPWSETLAGSTHSWMPPRVGDQCIILCPEGNLDRGIIIDYLNQSQHPAIRSNGDIKAVDFSDGSSIEVNESTGAMKIHATGDLSISCGGKLTINSAGNALIESQTDIAINAPHVGVND